MAESSPEFGSLFQQCLDDFRGLLQELEGYQNKLPEEDYPASPRLLIQAIDQYGRLRIWIHDFRADLPDRSRSSLGDNLRLDHELRGNVLSIVSSLSRQLLRARKLLSEPTEKASKSQRNDDSESDSGSESSDDDLESGPPLQRVLKQIFEQIQSLYYLGILLRRHTLSRRYLKSKSLPNRTEQVPVYIAPADISHVRETIRSWMTSKQGPRDPAEEKPVSWEEMKRRNEGGSQITDHDSVDVRLIERLAWANTRRREQFAYWQEHPDQPPFSPADQVLPVATASTQQGQMPQDAKSVKSAGTSLFSKESVTKSEILGPDVTSASAPVLHAPHTAYTATILDGTSSAGVPAIPKESESSETFDCPYCHLELNSNVMRDRATWKRHVFRDLRPYTCTDADCANGDKLYSSRSDWAYHEMQAHRRRWTCEQCDFVTTYRQEMVNHLQSNHYNEISARHWDSRLTIYERPMEDSQPTVCPFCPRQSTLGSLLKHLPKHMEHLSLFALPKPQFDVEGKNENSSELLGRSESTQSEIEEPTDRDLQIGLSLDTLSTMASHVSSIIDNIVYNSEDLKGLKDLSDKMLPGLYEISNLLSSAFAQAKTTPLNLKYQKQLDREKDKLATLLADIGPVLSVVSSEITSQTKPLDPNLNRPVLLRELSERLQTQNTELITLLCSALETESTPQELKTQSSDQKPDDQPESSQLRPELPIREPKKHTNTTSIPTTEPDLSVQTQLLTNTSSPAEERLAEASTPGVAGARKPSQAPRDPTFASQADPVRSKTAVNSDGRSSVRDGDHGTLSTFWVCHRCKELYLWETTRRCLNVDCQHVYCRRKCKIERYPVRAEIQR